MKVSKQFCVFIDILGFKNKMDNFDDALKYYTDYFTMYNKCDKCHSTIIHNISDALKSNLPAADESIESVENIVFSDSIILYSKDWKRLLFRVANIMSLLLSFGFLFRGGLGYGKHYSDTKLGQTQIVSEGLVQAVEIESKLSHYPRIVISRPALDEILIQMESLYDLTNFLIQSEDNHWFLNPFFLNPDIEPIYQRIKQDIEKYSTEEFVDKYVWMKELCEYFYMQKYIREYPSKYYYDALINQHFFYVKTFHTQIFNSINYSLSDQTYKNSFKSNIKQILQ